MAKSFLSKFVSGKSHSVSDVTAKYASLRPKKKPSDKVLSCRYELKYRVSEAKAHAIVAFIKLYLHVDEYAQLTPDGH